jgi:hypothetical protein
MGIPWLLMWYSMTATMASARSRSIPGARVIAKDPYEKGRRGVLGV